jgi:PAS domain S-box-containing protein
MATDIHDQKSIEEELRESKSLLQHYQQIAHVGNWKLEHTANRLTWSDEVFRIVGVDPVRTSPTYELFLEIIHPDDRFKVTDTFSDSLRKGLNSCEIEHRIVRRDTGEIRYVFERYVHEQDENGAVTTTYGIIQDITGHKNDTEEIRWRNEDLELMIAINNAVNQKESLASVINLISSRLKIIFNSHLLTVFIPDYETRDMKMYARELDQGLLQKIEKIIGRGAPKVRLLLDEIHPFIEVDQLGKGILYVGKKEVVRRLAGYLPSTPWPPVIQKMVKRLLPLICDLLDYQSSAALPMISNGITVGYIELGSREILSGHDLIRIQSIADHLASVIIRYEAEQKLYESERKYRTLFETMAQGVIYQDKMGRITSANPAAGRILGLTQDQMMGKTSDYPAWQIIHEDGSPYPVSAHPAFIALKTGQVSQARMGIINPSDQKQRWINVNAIPEFKNGVQEPMQVCTTFEDITDLKNAFDALGKTKEQLECKVNERTRELREINSFQKAILDNASSAILTTDLQGIIQSINPAGERMIGYTAAELIGRATPLDFHDKEERRRYLIEKTVNPDIPEDEQFSVMLTEMLGKSTELTLVKKNGQRFPVKISVSSLIGPDGELRGLMGLIYDITNEKEYLDAIQKSEAEIRAIVEAVPDLMFRLRRDGTILDYLSANESLLFLPKNQFNGRKISEVLPAEIANKSMHALQQTFTTFKVEQFEYMLPDGDTDRYYEDRIIAISNDEALSIIRDITTSYKAQKAMAEAKNEAVKANLAKSEFLSRMSHELRTPMNSILGFAQLLEMGDLSSKQKKGVNHIISQGRHLLRLINEVLDISGIEAGKQVLMPESIRLDTVIREMMDSLHPMAVNKRVSLNFLSGQGEALYVAADRLRLQQVLLNLINNAIKYNVEGGSVVVETICLPAHDHEEQRVRISVIDTGVGIPAEDLGKLFQPFERIGASNTNVEGTGLGLMLVKKITEAMGGHIGVESEPGKGSTFWFELPTSMTEHRESDPSTASPGHTMSDSHRHMTILYVEDNQSNIELVESIFSTFRPRVNLVTTSQGLEAKALTIEHQPHLILLDLDLPDTSGMDVLKTLLSDNHTNTIPVVVVSADAMPYQVNHAMTAGARDYITKPLEVVSFLKIIDSYLPG